MAELSLQLIIRNREKLIFQGIVKAVTSYNDKGVFDILSAHANFISLIKNKIVIHTFDQKTQEIPVDSGLLKAKRNQVEVFLGIVSMSGLSKELLKN